MRKQSGVVTVVLKNALRSDRTLMVEPWTTEYTLQSGQRYEVRAEGDLSLPLEIELTDEGVTLCSFDSEGALVTVFFDGVEVAPRNAST